MHCMLCDALLYSGGGPEMHHWHCAKIQKCLEERFWPEGHRYDIVSHLYKKYGLSLRWIPKHDIISAAGGIRNHWLVCRFLEEYPGAAGKYALREVQYYDVLAAAEKKYIGRTEYAIPVELEEM